MPDPKKTPTLAALVELAAHDEQAALAVEELLWRCVQAGGMVREEADAIGDLPEFLPTVADSAATVLDAADNADICLVYELA